MDNTEFALVVMPDPKNDMTYHIFLLDLVTENYKLVSTLEHTTKKEAQERIKLVERLVTENSGKFAKDYGAYVMEIQDDLSYKCVSKWVRPSK